MALRFSGGSGRELLPPQSVTRLMIVHENVEHELLRVWALISELSEQLQENRTVTADLRAQADALKVFNFNYTGQNILSIPF